MQTSGANLRWHVFFFHGPLDEVEKASFEARIAGFFTTLWEERKPTFDGPAVVEINYADEHGLAEFRAWTPHDESWFSANFQEVSRFNREVHKLISYQGSPFLEPSG
jgi:hypothetical protein